MEKKFGIGDMQIACLTTTNCLFHGDILRNCLFLLKQFQQDLKYICFVLKFILCELHRQALHLHPAFNPSCFTLPQFILSYLVIIITRKCTYDSIYRCLNIHFFLFWFGQFMHELALGEANSSILSSCWLSVALHTGVGLPGISLVHIIVPTCVFIIMVLFRQPYQWDFMGAIFFCYVQGMLSSRRHSGSLALTIYLCSLLQYFGWLSCNRLCGGYIS